MADENPPVLGVVGSGRGFLSIGEGDRPAVIIVADLRRTVSTDDPQQGILKVIQTDGYVRPSRCLAGAAAVGADLAMGVTPGQELGMA
jgi:hypothetical protein